MSGCENPCSQTQPLNTAACELLSSQIENFNLNFFGEVFKTEVNGHVNWSLPCRLDVGLPNNSRGATEPLACYFLRLLQNGVVGAPGEQGVPGYSGVNGRTPYVQIYSGFLQPVEGSTVTVQIFGYNPTMLPGMDVFIPGSGWYQILDAAESLGRARTDPAVGWVTLTLQVAVVSPIGFIQAGTYLLPTGKVGDAGAQGATGIPGPQGGPGPVGATGAAGAQGVAAPSQSVVLPLYFTHVPIFTINSNLSYEPNYYWGYEGGKTTAGFTPIILFPGAIPGSITLPEPGSYLVTGRCGPGEYPITINPNSTPPQTSVAGGNSINDFKVKNITTNTFLPQSLVRASYGMLQDFWGMIRFYTFVQTLTPNNVIQLYAQAVAGDGIVGVQYFRDYKVPCAKKNHHAETP